MRWKAMLLLSTAVGLLVGCSEVRIKKVRTPTQYDTWTDDDQRREDEKEGFRFYMQRPFLSVYQPFPVHARSYLVSGHASIDGRFVVLDGCPTTCSKETKQENDELRDVMRLCYGCGAGCVPSAAIFEPSPVTADAGGGRGAGRGGEQGADDGATDAAPSGDAAAGDKPAGPSLTSPLPNVIGGMDAAGSRGITELGVHVSNDPYPMTPLRTPLFDLVNLPDFDEQFVVRRVQGIGSASMDLGLGQGNLLQGFDARLDNSSVANLVYGLMYTASNVLVARNLNPLGIKAMTPGSIAAGAPAKKPGEQGKENGEPFLPGYAPVTLRVHVVTYATPGMYPIMKPRECADWDRARRLRDECGHAACTALTCQDGSGKTVVRMGPYGIPYNTFQYVLVEYLDRGNGSMPVIPAEKPLPDSAAMAALVKEKVLAGDAKFRATAEVLRTSLLVTIYQLDAAHEVDVATRARWATDAQALAAGQGLTLIKIGMPLTSEQRGVLTGQVNAATRELGWQFAVGPEVDGKLPLTTTKSPEGGTDKEDAFAEARSTFRKFIARENASGRQLDPK